MKSKKIAIDGIFLGLLIVCSQISIPIPLVPITLQTFAIGIIASLFSLSEGLLIIFSYLLLGLAGLPVFAGFVGGLPILLSPVGGYLLGFPLYIIVTRLIIKLLPKNNYSLAIANMVAAAMQLFTGSIWMVYFSHFSFIQAIMVGFVPFIIPALIKIYLVVIIVKRLPNLFFISKV